MWDFGAGLAVTRVALRLIRRMGDAVEIGIATGRLYDGILTLSGKLELVEMVGHREHVGHGLVSKDRADELETDLRGAISNASASDLAHERQLPQLVMFGAPENEEERRSWAQQRAMHDPFLLRLIAASMHDTYRQTIGEAHQSRQLVLSWDWLLSVLGFEFLRDRLLGMRDRFPPDDWQEREHTAIALADRYVAGWRPPDR